MRVRVLVVDDSEEDALLVCRELERGGFEVESRRVDSAQALRAALDHEAWDVVLADWTMPSFDGPSAVAQVAAGGGDLPVIIVSGTVGEDVIVEAVRRGASDYVIKRDLRRLVPAVEREVTRRRQRLNAGAALAESRALVAALEDHLQMAQRMEGIGRVAGAIAHDFNNVLTVICASAGFVLERMLPGDPLHADVLQIRNAAERGASLVGQLLAFSRRQTLCPEPVDLNARLRELVRVLGHTLGDAVKLELALSDVPAIKVDPTKLDQVLLNLVVNARDAMPDGGTLTVETAEAFLDPAESVDRFELPSGRYVRLTIVDTGVGMSEKVRARAFEPFFTTKERGKGTGLGLASVYGVVRQSGGAVEVASEPGRGTRFDIYLPVANELLEAVRPWAEAGRDDATGDETILVVDDEELVRRAAARMLRGAGYNVLEADSGASAIALAETYQGRIHLVVTDMIMPEMTGQELANKLVKARTDARVLFTSGSGEVLESNEPLDAGLVFLQKPFSGPALLHKVRETLDGPQPPEDRPERG